MIGIVIQLIITWALLHFVEHKKLTVLGPYPTRQHVKDILLGLFAPIGFWCILNFTIAALVHNPYQVNPNYTIYDFFTATAYVVKAVVYEELIFRGALLYILIRRMGTAKATLLSATAFGIYHWFSWGILGHPFQMLIAFLNTGLLGYLLALMFVKKQSMYLPAAFHLGGNFASMIIFSRNHSIGLQLLVKTYVKDPVVPPAYISFIMVVIYHIGIFLLGYAILKYSKAQLPLEDSLLNANHK